jgi:hypothetical protein
MQFEQPPPIKLFLPLTVLQKTRFEFPPAIIEFSELEHTILLQPDKDAEPKLSAKFPTPHLIVEQVPLPKIIIPPPPPPPAKSTRTPFTPTQT